MIKDSNLFADLIFWRYNYAGKSVRNKSVLDVGCGTGYGTNCLANLGAEKVTGIDISKKFIDIAKKKYIKPNVRFEVLDALKLERLEEKFDIITCFEVLEHLPIGTHEEFLSDVGRILKSEGKLFLSTPNRLLASPGSDKPLFPYHTKEFSPKELKEILERHFQSVVVYGVRYNSEERIKRIASLVKRPQNKLASFAVRFGIVHKILPLIPKGVRNLVTGLHFPPEYDTDSYATQKNHVESCMEMLAIAKGIKN